MVTCRSTITTLMVIGLMLVILSTESLLITYIVTLSVYRWMETIFQVVRMATIMVMEMIVAMCVVTSSITLMVYRFRSVVTLMGIIHMPHLVDLLSYQWMEEALQLVYLLMTVMDIGVVMYRCTR